MIMVRIISSTFQNKHLFEDALQLPIVGGASGVQHLILMSSMIMLRVLVMMSKTLMMFKMIMIMLRVLFMMFKTIMNSR